MQKLAEINWSDFLKGEGQADLIPSGGFSPRSYGLNLTKERGKLYFIEPETDIGGVTLTGNVIAMAYDRTLSGNDGYALDDAGNLYTIASNGTFALRQTMAGNTFARGNSDLLQLRVSGISNNASLCSTFATSETTIRMYGGANLDEGSETAGQAEWWTGLNSGVRHPLEIVEDRMFCGDFNLVHAWDSISTTGSFVTLPPDVNITSLRKHPDGRTLLAFCGLSQNFGHTRGVGGRVYYIDPSIKDWTREVELEAQVEGTRVVGGVIYVTYGNNLGYFDGNGIKFIKKLSIATTDTTTTNAVYSHQLAGMEDTLLVASDYEALAYGNLGAGNVFWRPYRSAGNRTITAMLYRGDNRMLYAYKTSAATEKLIQIDYDNIGVNGTFYTNHYFFDDFKNVKRIDYLHDLTNSAGTSRFQLEYRKHSGGGTEIIEDKTYTNESTNRTRIDCEIKTDVFQLYFVPTTDDIGITSLRIYGDAVKY